MNLAALSTFSHDSAIAQQNADASRRRLRSSSQVMRQQTARVHDRQYVDHAVANAINDSVRRLDDFPHGVTVVLAHAPAARGNCPATAQRSRMRRIISFARLG